MHALYLCKTNYTQKMTLKSLHFGLLLVSLISPFLSSSQVNYALKEEVPIRKDSIQIVRDNFGVPHVYAPTDIEAIYGLVWAQCEDDFISIQEVMAMSNGFYGRWKGKEGAKLDYVTQLLKLKETAIAEYDKAYSPEFKKILKAATMAANRYAEIHPDEVKLKGVFPISEYDYVTGYLLGMSFMASIQDVLPKLFEDKFAILPVEKTPTGSNGIAVHSSKTEDGYNYIDINSHQPLQGPFSWYECHVESKEGLKMMGGLLIGSMIPNIGTNGNISWTHTLNYNDFFDVYKLTMHPKDKNLYKFDGKYLPLEVTKAKLKLKGISVSKKIYYSVHGPVVMTKSGAYALRGLSYKKIGAPEQWYNMCKAENFTQFYEALKAQEMPSINIVYADKNDTIFYISNGLYPTERMEGINWRGVIQGDTSATLWSEDKVMRVEDIPQMLNPSSGYLYSVNQSPFLITNSVDQLKKEDYPLVHGWQERPLNRSQRLSMLMDTVDVFTWETFKRIKLDKKYPNKVIYLCDVDKFKQIDLVKNPDLKDAVELLSSAPVSGEINDSVAALSQFAFLNLQKNIENRAEYIPYEVELSMDIYVDCLRRAKAHMLKHFGAIKIPLGTVQRLRKGDKDLPMFGLPDVLTPIYSKVDEKDGTLVPLGGETYCLLLKIGAKGMEMESYQAFGQSNNPKSKHYTDQMELFTQGKFKKMTMDKTEIFKNAEAIYTPE
ncbi:MAG: penicillin acylase family protein [Bacteroidota bacterium]